MCMDWHEVKLDGPGPKMLFPMAWSLLPLVGGCLLIYQGRGLLVPAMLASGIMISLIAVWIGATISPGRVDFAILLISPFAAFGLFFQPPEIVQVIVAISVWTINYRTAAMLSAISGKAYRLEWDPKKPLPMIESARFFHTKWAARPLFRIGKNIVRGVKEGDKIYIESDEPLSYFSDEE